MGYGRFDENELLTWKGLNKKNRFSCLIPLSIFWIIGKERNNRAFEGREDYIINIKDRWFRYFASIVLGQPLYIGRF